MPRLWSSSYLLALSICLLLFIAAQFLISDTPYDDVTLLSCTGCLSGIIPRQFPPPERLDLSAYLIAGYNHTTTKDCNFAACELNTGYTPVIFQPATAPCKKLEDCVTLTIKTRHRLHFVASFIRSFYVYFPYTRVIVADEIHSDGRYVDYPKTWTDLLNGLPLGSITYFQTTPGVGHGRNIALDLVKTPYVLVADDDFLMTPRTNLNELLHVLENTDVDIVGGATDDAFPYEGVIRIVDTKDGAQVVIYPNVFYQNISTPSARCFSGSIIKNFFMARTESVQKAGAWDGSRRYFEHEDFFLNMRKAGVKIGHCPGVVIRHHRRGKTLHRERMSQVTEWQAHLRNKWGIKDLYYCRDVHDYLNTDFCRKPQTVF